MSSSLSPLLGLRPVRCRTWTRLPSPRGSERDQHCAAGSNDASSAKRSIYSPPGSGPPGSVATTALSRKGVNFWERRQRIPPPRVPGSEWLAHKWVRFEGLVDTSLTVPGVRVCVQVLQPQLVSPRLNVALRVQPVGGNAHRVRDRFRSACA